MVTWPVVFVGAVVIFFGWLNLVDPNAGFRAENLSVRSGAEPLSRMGERWYRSQGAIMLVFGAILLVAGLLA